VRHPAQPISPDIAVRDATNGEKTLYINGSQAMQEWEAPLMRRSAELLCRKGGAFLECGLGFGISALVIARHPKTTKHTVVEIYPEVIEQFRKTTPELPENLELANADFFEYIESVPDDSVDGMMFDPWLPREIRDDKKWWNRLMTDHVTRVIKPGGQFMSFFVTEPTIEPRWEPYFSEVLIERIPFESYSTTSYLMGKLSGTAYLQCFTNTR
jgi:spermidine synthase